MYDAYLICETERERCQYHKTTRPHGGPGSDRRGPADKAPPRADTIQIKPLTEEEKKAKLAELRQKLAEKRAGQAKEDAVANKANEVCFLAVLPPLLPLREGQRADR